MDKTEVFGEWLSRELDKRGWTQSELARRSGVSRQVVSVYINQQREKPDETILAQIAHALKLPPEDVYRAAGILPQSPFEDPQAKEAAYLVSLLSEDRRRQALDFLRFLADKQ